MYKEIEHPELYFLQENFSEYFFINKDKKLRTQLRKLLYWKINPFFLENELGDFIEN